MFFELKDGKKSNAFSASCSGASDLLWRKEFLMEVWAKDILLKISEMCCQRHGRAVFSGLPPKISVQQWCLSQCFVSCLPHPLKYHVSWVRMPSCSPPALCSTAYGPKLSAQALVLNNHILGELLEQGLRPCPSTPSLCLLHNTPDTMVYLGIVLWPLPVLYVSLRFFLPCSCLCFPKKTWLETSPQIHELVTCRNRVRRGDWA